MIIEPDVLHICRHLLQNFYKMKRTSIASLFLKHAAKKNAISRAPSPAPAADLAEEQIEEVVNEEQIEEVVMEEPAEESVQEEVVTEEPSFSPPPPVYD